MKKFSDVIQIVIFMVTIIGLMLAMFIIPDKKFSEQENRVLKDAPKFSVKALKSGELMKEFEVYLTDQFPLRDEWIGLKSYTEKVSLKTENNNVLFCEDDVIIKRFNEPDRDILEKNIGAVNKLVECTDIPVYFSLIPGAVSIWDDKLPENANVCNQKELIDEIYSKVECETIDNYSVLKEHKDEYIFYKTDHHWTSLGAYYGHKAVLDAFDIKAKDLDECTKECVSDEFYGTVYSSSGVRWVKPDEIDIYVSDEDKVVNKVVGSNLIDGVFYDYEKLKVKDKYSFFFGGNTPLLKITSNCDNGKKLLVIRDSYSDSEVPFLTEHFSEIYLMDLRYYKFGVQYFLSQFDVDAILVNYSVDNFSEDANVVMIGN
ncbi:MAG: hypothetical protein IJA34_11435 [Lachnospiraceae bacterium]|nr:hypothetical protein [Lachnospiraceae bacterium]